MVDHTISQTLVYHQDDPSFAIKEYITRVNDQTHDSNDSNLENCKNIKVEELKIKLIETKCNNDGQYSLLLPKELSGCQIFIFGLLGSGKSALMNYFFFRDLNVIQKGLRYVVEVDDDWKNLKENL